MKCPKCAHLQEEGTPECRFCGLIFSHIPSPEQGATVREIISLPDATEILRGADQMELTAHWYYKELWYIALAIGAWNLYWTYAWLFDNRNEPFATFTCIVATYLLAANWFNHTRIVISKGRLIVRHGPLPWFGNHDLRTLSLKQLYVKRHIRRREGQNMITYDVWVTTRAGRHFVLVGGLQTSEQALYIEQEIEIFLGIADKPVKNAIVA
jgi:hypothetical protein